MRMILETHGFDVDGWLDAFLRSTVTFAVWHHEGRVSWVSARLEREELDDGQSVVRCSLGAETREGRIVSVVASSPDVHEACLDAATRLEVSLFPETGVFQSDGDRLAA